MSFLDTLKKREGIYITLLSIGIVILVINNLFQFIDLVLKNKWILLLSSLSFVWIVIYLKKHKKEVYR